MIDERILDRIELFRDANAAARRELAMRAALVRFAAGEVLWTAGSPARGLFVVVAGRVRVVRAPAGRPHVVHVEGPGGTLGEVPLFLGGRYPATAIASEPALCVAIGRDALEAAIARDPALAFVLLRRLAERVRGLIDRLDGVTSRSVPARLAAFLLERAGAAGGAGFTLGQSQRELAEELGTVREVLVRALAEMRRSGAVESLGRGRYRVADEATLRRMAGDV